MPQWSLSWNSKNSGLHGKLLERKEAENWFDTLTESKNITWALLFDEGGALIDKHGRYPKDRIPKGANMKPQGRPRPDYEDEDEFYDPLE